MNHRPTAIALAAACLALAGSAPAQTPPDYAAAIVAAAHRDRGPLEACVDAHHAEARAAWRRVRSVSATVRPDGHLADVRVDGASAPAVEACLRPVIERWQFAPPAAGAPVRLVYSRGQILRAARSG